MKSKYLISYDLRNPGRNYQPVYDYLASLSDKIKPLQSVYLVYTNLSAKQLRDGLQTHVDSNDMLLVIPINTDEWASYNLSAAAIAWLNSH